MNKYFNSFVSLRVWIAGIVFLALFSCETMDGEPVYIGYEYFGQKEGKWVIYEVDSIVYDDFLGQVFTYNYQVKEVFTDVNNNDNGAETIRIERFYRKDESESWGIKNVWPSLIDERRATRTEENITFVKLAFPLKLNLTWNGNAFNTQPAQNYRITDIHVPMEINNLSFDSTLTVLQKDFTTLIGEEYQYEVFATGVGMIRKYFKELSKEIDGTIIRGVDYSYSILDYGFDDQAK